MDDDAPMRAALEQASLSLADDVGGPFGAVVVRGSEIVGRGRNRVLADCDPTAHAEVMAIRDAARHLGTHVLADCVIYTTCAPCPMCLTAIYWARIQTIIQGASAADAAAVGFDDRALHDELARAPEDRRIPVRTALAADAIEVMRLWGERPDRRLY